MHFMWLNKHDSLYSGYLDVKGLVVCPTCCCARPAAPDLVSVLAPLISELFSLRLLWLLSEAPSLRRLPVPQRLLPVGKGRWGESRHSLRPPHSLTIWSIAPGRVPVGGRWVDR